MVVSGYTLDLYCDKCEGKKWPYPKSTGGIPISTFFEDGPNSYSEVRKKARSKGWILTRDNRAICPKCSGKKKNKAS